MRLESLASLLSVAGRSARFLDLLPQPIRGCGHIDVLDAERRQRIAHGIDDCDGACDRAGFTDALDAKLVGWRRSDRSAELKVGKLVRGRDQVVGERSRLHLPRFVVVYDLFVEGLRNALCNAAMDLAVDDHRVDDVAAVVDRNVALEIDMASLGIDPDHRAVSAAGTPE